MIYYRYVIMKFVGCSIFKVYLKLEELIGRYVDGKNDNNNDKYFC